MKFDFEANSEQSVLRAIFEEGDHNSGPRQEGPGTEITYSGQEITFDYAVNDIHPDILGLLCLTIFYPFIGDRVVFPMQVSPQLERAFRNPYFKNQFCFDNVNNAVEPYSGSRMALSFGGGIDSSAIRKMFPEAFVVHEAHLKNGELLPSGVYRVVHQLGSTRGRVVATNQRYVSSPGGWHGWTCAFAATLLLATDNDFGIILMGSKLGGTLLTNGTKYYDRFSAMRRHGITGNYWQSAFNAIGLPVYSPVCGASAFLTMYLSLDLLRSGDVYYCMQQDGEPCLRCAKCFRRDIIRTVVDPDYFPYWRPYNRPAIRAALENRPMRYGHLFAFARDRVDALPTFAREQFRHLPAIETDWPLRVHAGTFDFCDEHWRSSIRERALEHLVPMRPDDIKEMERWNLTEDRAAP